MRLCTRFSASRYLRATGVTSPLHSLRGNECKRPFIAVVKSKMTLKNFMDRLAHSTAMVAVICFMLCELGCSPVGAVAERHPDEALFERAMDAIKTKHFTVAHLTLETLINTYPDSEYADKATSALRDPRIANCGDGWTTSADCEIAEPAWPR